MDSAAETIPPRLGGVRVKTWCKRPRLYAVMGTVGKPRLEQGQIKEKELIRSVIIPG